MKGRQFGKREEVVAVGFLLLPLLHPFLLPHVGVASHLLWFVHVPAVGLLAFDRGRVGAAIGLLASGALVASGESILGAGFFTAAPDETVLALTTATLLVGTLVAGVALFARNSAARYHSLFDAADIALLRLDSSDTVVEANQAALGLFGVGGIEGVALSQLIKHPATGELMRLGAQGPWAGCMEVVAGTGTRPLRGELQVLADRGGTGSQVLIRDRSLEINQAEELERKSKLATLGEALAGVAHELNNPLSVIMGHASLEIDSHPNSPSSESLEIILDQSQRIKGLVAELLGFSRVRGPESGAAIATISRKVARLQQVSTGAVIKIVTEVGWEGTVPVRADQFEQVLLNLVGNAIYAVRHGPGSGLVQVAVLPPIDGKVRVEVQDDGGGIAPEVIDSIFHPFVTTKPEGEGTGLGLAICRRLARSWGGDLTAVNRKPGGACFQLTIPLEGASVSMESTPGDAVESVSGTA